MNFSFMSRYHRDNEKTEPQSGRKYFKSQLLKQGISAWNYKLFKNDKKEKNCAVKG